MRDMAHDGDTRQRREDPAFGRMLADQRRRAGWTQRELARRMDVAPSTVASAERGEEPRASTLQRCLAALPCLGARRLLVGPDAAPAPSSEAVLTLYRSFSGLDARRVSVRLACAGDGTGRTELLVEGLTCGSLDPGDPATLRQLVRAVHRGSPEPLRDVPWPAPGTEAAVDVRDGSVTHSYRIPARAEDGLTYRRTESVALDAARLDPDERTTLFHAPGHPLGELVLAVRPPSGRGVAGVRHECRPSAVGMARELPPIPSRLRRLEHDPAAGEAGAVIASPLPHLAHRLTWTEARESHLAPGRASLPAGLPPAERLRAIREREGLSVRALASLLGTGPASVSGAEAGRDVRLSTLRAYLRALPGLDPDDLLPEPAPGRAPGRREAWEWLRALHGVEAGVETKHVRVARDGSASVSYVTRGLRRLDAGEGPLAVRYGADPLARGHVAPPSLIEPRDAPRGAVPDLRTRLVRLADGLTIHELTFDAESAARGVDYERRVELAPAFATSREAAAGPLGAGVDGTTFTAAFPVRRLEIEVALPPGVRVRDVRALAWPALVVPSDGGAAAAALLHPEGLPARWEATRRCARLVVEEPLPGVRYVLAWAIA